MWYICLFFVLTPGGRITDILSVGRTTEDRKSPEGLTGITSTHQVIFSKYLLRSNRIWTDIYSTRCEAPSRLFSSYSMRLRKIFALSDGPEEDTFMSISLGVCELLNHVTFNS